MRNFLIADNTPFAEEVFAPMGRVERFAGRKPAPRQLAEADVLLVRSITQVDAELLSFAPNLTFVGTATIGSEHLDKQALRERNIQFTNCPGANADSVGEYVLTALLAVAQRKAIKLKGLRAAIVGAGHTGQAAGQRLSGLGLTVDYYDPPRAERDENFVSISFADVLSADIISLHVPLYKTGVHKTYHLLSHQELAQLGSSQILINASRGPVICEHALLKWLQQSDATVVLDVWEYEPKVSAELLSLVAIGTPHIAGHSLNGKVRGTQMLYDACAKHFGWQQQPDWQTLMPAPTSLQWSCQRTPSQQTLAQWVLQNYDIWQDDAAMRKSGVTASGFDALRRNYPVRFELSSQIMKIADSLSAEAQQRLRQLGFTIL